MGRPPSPGLMPVEDLCTAQDADLERKDGEARGDVHDDLEQLVGCLVCYCGEVDRSDI